MKRVLSSSGNKTAWRLAASAVVCGLIITYLLRQHTAMPSRQEGAARGSESAPQGKAREAAIPPAAVSNEGLGPSISNPELQRRIENARARAEVSLRQIELKNTKFYADIQDDDCWEIFLLTEAPTGKQYAEYSLAVSQAFNFEGANSNAAADAKNQLLHKYTDFRAPVRLLSKMWRDESHANALNVKQEMFSETFVATPESIIITEQSVTLMNVSSSMAILDDQVSRYAFLFDALSPPR